jgi:hypothetical protein
MTSMPPPCLRCSTTLRRLEEPGTGVEFFECPACGRHFAQQSGKGLTFRWLHPISLALYPVLSDIDLSAAAPSAVEALSRGRNVEELASFADEIALELAQPTQQVRDILGNAAPEAACRAFLAAVVRLLRAA